MLTVPSNSCAIWLCSKHATPGAPDARVVPPMLDRLLAAHTRYLPPVPTISLPVVSRPPPRRPFRTSGYFSTVVLFQKAGAAGPGSLLGRVATGFQSCHVAVHKGNILAGFGRARVKLVVIEKERSRCGRKRQDEVCNSAGPVPLFQ